ncbi:MAG: two-component system sensor histidine kinase NtrB [Bacteriovoracia bacterium]
MMRLNPTLLRFSSQTRTNVLILTQGIGFYLWGEFFKTVQAPDDAYTLRMLVVASNILGFLYFVLGNPAQRMRDQVTNFLVFFASLQIAISTHYTNGHYIGLLGGMIAIAAGISIIRGTLTGIGLVVFWIISVPVIIVTTPGIEYPLIFATSFLTAVFVGFLAFVEYEAALRERDESFNLARRVVDNMAEAILFFDPESKVTLANQSMNELLKVDGKKLVGSKLGDMRLKLFDPMERLIPVEEIPSSIARATRKPVINFQGILQRHDGSKRSVLINAIPIDGMNTSVNILLTMQDVTVLETARREIETQRLALAHSSRMSSLGEMAAGIAHEINNPLAIILGRVEQIKLVGNLDPEVLRFVDSLENGVNRIASIIRSMRLVTNNERADLEEGMVDVNQTITTVMNLFSEKMRLFEIDVTSSFQKPFEISGRPAQLAQAFMNLFQNAIQAQEQLFIRWIRVETFEDHGDIVIRITNNGSIPEAIKDKIGQPFFTTREVGEGSGLGISNSMQIINAMGGTVVFGSDNGTTHFDIRLRNSTHQ